MTRRRTVLTAASLVLVLGVAFGLYWFQPWKLWVDERVDEALPAVALADEPSPDVTRPPSPTGATPTPAATPTPSATPTPGAPASDVVLARGRLISHEHATSGTVSIVRLANGERVLTLAGLETSNGPDVEVWLTDAPVLRGERGWYVFDDGAHRSLGELKGNLGNQVYRIPADVRLSRYTSVSLWCARFDVSFGAAELTALRP